MYLMSTGLSVLGQQQAVHLCSVLYPSVSITGGIQKCEWNLNQIKIRSKSIILLGVGNEEEWLQGQLTALSSNTGNIA